MFVILACITHTSANDFETVAYDESSELISEMEDVNYLDSKVLFTADDKMTDATSQLYFGCYELKRVWTWSGWRPKRVWKWVKVDCPQAASNRSRGPGTTIPPH